MDKWQIRGWYRSEESVWREHVEFVEKGCGVGTKVCVECSGKSQSDSTSFKFDRITQNSIFQFGQDG